MDTSWITGARPARSSFSVARVRLGHFNGRQQVSEEALLGLLEGGVGGGLRRGVQGLAVLHGAGGFQGRDDVCWWMMRKAPA